MPWTQKTWSKPIFILVAASLAYLALPYLIFFIGWLKWPWAVTFSILLLIGAWYAFVDFLKNDRIYDRTIGGSEKLTLKSVLVLLLICVTLVAISGMGGYGHQDEDWRKHNVVLKDLVDREWPVRYEHYGKSVSLVYYISFYLPAALVGKVGGWEMANHAQALWGIIGLLLALSWFMTLMKRSPIYAAIFFIFFSGLDVVGSLLTHHPIAQIWAEPARWPTEWVMWEHLDSWASRWQYVSNMNLLFWVPNQALVGWITAGLILYSILYTSSKKSLILLLVLTTLWSPLVTIGVVPYLIGDFLFERSSLFARLKQYVSLPNLCGLLILIVIALFYATKLTGVIPLLDGQIRSTFLLSEIDGWSDRLRWLALLAVFCFLEIGLLVLLIRSTGVSTSAKTRWLFKVTIVWLCVLPFYVFGHFNDLAMRASIPALFFLGILAGQSFYESSDNRIKRFLWITFFVIGSLTPLNEIGRHLVGIYERGQIRHFRFTERYNVVERYAVRFDLVRQYVSDSDTLFFNLFAKACPDSCEGREAPENTKSSDDPYLLFDDKMILFDDQLDKQTANAGDTLNLLLALRAIKAMDVNYSLTTRLMGPQDIVLWEEHNWPVGWPTSKWQPERKLWHDNRTPVIPPDAPSGIYRLEIYFSDPTTWDKLAVHTIPSGNALPSIVPLTYVVVGDLNVTPEYALAEPVHFADQIALLGSNVPSHIQAVTGESISIRLIWETLNVPDLDYTGFVHLLDQQGQLVSQQDHSLIDGVVPTTLWQVGLTVPDTYQLQIPDDLADGSYSLVVGLYNLESGQRLLVTQDADQIGDVFKISDLVVGASENVRNRD